MKKLFRILALIFVAPFALLLFVPAPDDTSTADADAAPSPAAGLPQDFTLADYAATDAADRAGIIRAGLADMPDAALARLDDFVTCMGDMTYHKSAELAFREVLGWCETERVKLPEDFADHFDELAAPDLETEAFTVCKSLVRDRLLAPASADFPWLSRRVWSRPRNQYIVKSHVDVENEYGAMVRVNYRCDITYSGHGEEVLPRSWNVADIAFGP